MSLLKLPVHIVPFLLHVVFFLLASSSLVLLFLSTVDNVGHLLWVALIGERSKPSMGRWMKNFVLLRMPICGIYIYMLVYVLVHIYIYMLVYVLVHIYIYIYMLVYVLVHIYVLYVHKLRVHRRFYGLNLKKEMVVLETCHRYARFVNKEENGC